MKPVIPSDTRYLPIPQEKYCCVPACLSMVMHRHDIPLLPQQLLGYHLGLIVPEEEAKFFWNARTGKKPPSGYGTQIYKKNYAINPALSKLGIPLKMAFHPISKFGSLDKFEKFISEAVGKDKDILVCFDDFKMRNLPDQGGHVCVVDVIHTEEDKVRLIDPAPLVPKWRTVKTSHLYDAARFHGNKKMGGFWEFTKIRK